MSSNYSLGRPFVEPFESYDQPTDGAKELSDLDLTSDTLRWAVEYGHSFLADASSHDPPSSVGITVWGKTVRALRDRLVPMGWVAENYQNYATTIHPSRRYAIAAAAGDERTGRLGNPPPSTRAPKGISTSLAVLTNKNQLRFSDISEEWEVSPRQTWLLLYYYDEAAEKLRVELSYPVGMSADGHVDEWNRRIILSSEGDIVAAVDDDEDEFDIPVTMKI